MRLFDSNAKAKACDLTDRNIERNGLLHKNKLREILANVGNGTTGRYMNAHHQRIIARATIRGDPAMRFVMWCARCGTTT